MDFKELLFFKKGKFLISFFLMGLCGMLIEIFFTALLGNKLTPQPHISLMGVTSLWCILIYGTGGSIVAILNESPKFYQMSMLKQTLLGGTLVVFIEFLYGVLFNLVMGLGIWNYTSSLNLLGQIDLFHSLCWYIGIPFFIWMYDTVIGYGLYHEEWYYNVVDNYKSLLKDIVKLLTFV